MIARVRARDYTILLGSLILRGFCKSLQEIANSTFSRYPEFVILINIFRKK